ncbi:hypothetical protein N7475_006055 [Penicillium sp. IBT 31633x]|nr:hypothetical protein N7475_006055 [Penicillium sp. IBT 31633x]
MLKGECLIDESGVGQVVYHQPLWTAQARKRAHPSLQLHMLDSLSIKHGVYVVAEARKRDQRAGKEPEATAVAVLIVHVV